MIKKTRIVPEIWIGLLFSIATCWSYSVDIQGAVKDSLTGEGISGAVVFLENSGHICTTGADGTFHLRESAVMRQTRFIKWPDRSRFVFNGRRLCLYNMRSRHVNACIVNAQGKTVRNVFEGTVLTDEFRLTVPGFLSGYHVFVIETDHASSSVPFISYGNSSGKVQWIFSAHNLAPDSEHGSGTETFSGPAQAKRLLMPDTLSVMAYGYIPKRIDMAGPVVTGMTVLLTQASLVTADIRGSVVDDSGNPSGEGLDVRLKTSAGSEISTVTDAQGAFHFQEDIYVDETSYGAVTVNKAGYLSEAEILSIPVADDLRVREPVARLSESKRVIRGAVVWRGKAVRGASVCLPRYGICTVTDNYGRFSLSYVPVSTFLYGEYVALRVVARGYYERKMIVKRDIYTRSVYVTASMLKDTRAHLWAWGTGAVTDTVKRTELFDFAQEKNIGTLYIDCGGIIYSNKTAIAAFCNRAHARRLSVELLFGASHWALTENHGVPIGIANEIIELASLIQQAGGTLPTSIQMDVEPYTLDVWNTARNSTANQLIDMYEKIAAVMAHSRMGVTACIPRWFDLINIVREGETRPLSDYIAEVTDRVTIMDYVDNALSIINDASHEAAFAEAEGKEFVIGVETIPGLEPPSVTFAEEGEAFMLSCLEQAKSHYDAYLSFHGVAIHHYGSYKTMIP